MIEDKDYKRSREREKFLVADEKETKKVEEQSTCEKYTVFSLCMSREISLVNITKNCWIRYCAPNHQ